MPRPTALTDLKGGQLGGVDWQLLFYFAAWYLGNYYYTLNNKLALKAAGGASGFPVSIAFFQMLLGRPCAPARGSCPTCARRRTSRSTT